MLNQSMICRRLRSLTANFYYVVVLIKESNNIFEMKLEEIKASLEAHEMRLA